MRHRPRFILRRDGAVRFVHSNLLRRKPLAERVEKRARMPVRAAERRFDFSAARTAFFILYDSLRTGFAPTTLRPCWRYRTGRVVDVPDFPERGGGQHQVPVVA